MPTGLEGPDMMRMCWSRAWPAGVVADDQITRPPNTSLIMIHALDLDGSSALRHRHVCSAFVRLPGLHNHKA